MTKLNLTALLVFAFLGFTFCAGTENSENDDGWISLFDGESLDGWQVGENAETIWVEEDYIRIDGPRAHLYYVGEVENANFINFEFKTQVLTKPEANSGVYFHTEYRETGWPDVGYEVQVNNSHSDWRKTGSLWDVMDIKETYVDDDEWFELYFKVDGKDVEVKINGTKVLHYHEPENPLRADGAMQNRVLNSGTFALQGHDPNSVMFFKDIYVRPLP
ncbi:MAG: DUF1080 domain-containing protein [Balneolaceae bacterium]|nr:DUF1080 domain-containing protein [Balneolaceae bacterium]